MTQPIVLSCTSVLFDNVSPNPSGPIVASAPVELLELVSVQLEKIGIVAAHNLTSDVDGVLPRHSGSHAVAGR